MPEAGRTPSPQFKKQDLPFGEAAQLNEAVGLIPPPDDEEFQPQGDAESFVFSETDRPQEAFSAGLPFGKGPGYVPQADESDDQLVMRVANQVKADPAAPKQLRQFADRALNGM